MAFQHKNLSMIAYANGFTMWHYKTEDKLDDVLNEGYFGDSTILMNTGDMFVLNLGDQNCVMFIKNIDNKKIKWS